MEQNVQVSPPISLTPKAVEMVKATREQEGMADSFALRVAVRGGGCSGFEYALDFDQEARPNDTVLDYVTGMTGAGFKFNNPKALGTCGCGSSFSV